VLFKPETWPSRELWSSSQGATRYFSIWKRKYIFYIIDPPKKLKKACYKKHKPVV
jgi:hypothetical protein